MHRFMVPHINTHRAESIRPEWITSADLTSEGGYQSAKRMSWVPDPPQAAVCVMDETAQEFPVNKIARQPVRMLAAVLEGKDLLEPWINHRPILPKRASTGD